MKRVLAIAGAAALVAVALVVRGVLAGDDDGSSGAGVYLALVAEDYEPEAVPPVPAITDKLPGEDENKLTPYGPDGNTE